MARGGAYGTREYHGGTQMTDLAPRPSRRGRGATASTGLRVLVVDDDLGVCQSVRDLLAEEGCDVITASGGLRGA